MSTGMRREGRRPHHTPVTPPTLAIDLEQKLFCGMRIARLGLRIAADVQTDNGEAHR